MSFPLIGALIYADGVYPERVIAHAVERLRDRGIALAGALQRTPENMADRHACDLLIEDLNHAIDGFAALTGKHRRTATVARTLQQHAAPMPFGSATTSPSSAASAKQAGGKKRAPFICCSPCARKRAAAAPAGPGEA